MRIWGFQIPKNTEILREGNSFDFPAFGDSYAMQIIHGQTTERKVLTMVQKCICFVFLCMYCYVLSSLYHTKNYPLWSSAIGRHCSTQFTILIHIVLLGGWYYGYQFKIHSGTKRLSNLAFLIQLISGRAEVASFFQNVSVDTHLFNQLLFSFQF
jgi:hypothetical protein